jgi:hypothetical protein
MTALAVAYALSALVGFGIVFIGARFIDLTQASLGQRVGCATVTIHKLERDQLRPHASWP